MESTACTIGHGFPGRNTTAIASLRAEHAVIREVLSAATRALDEGDCFDDRSFWEDTITFLQDFGDRCHHRKEESVLFPRLEMRGGRRAGPIAIMLAEHEEARALLHTMAALLPDLAEGAAGVQELFRRAARQYCELVALHIAKENGILFPLAERLLSDEDAHDLMQRFQLLDGKSGDAHARRRLLVLADRIRRAV